MQPSAPKASFARQAARLAREAFSAWSDDDAPRLAAALAYYAVLSTAPLLVLSVAIADQVYGEQAVNGQLAWEIQNFVGGDAAQAIQAALQGAHKPAASAIATYLSSATLAVGASSVIVELHSALNFIWGVKAPADTSWRRDLVGFFKDRLYAALIAVAGGCLLLISLALSVSIAAVGQFVLPLLPSPEGLLHLAAFVASFLVVMLLFAAVYKLLPDVRLKWGDVASGAALASLLFTIGKQLIALYLGRVGFESTYGAAWALVLFLVWVYYSAQLFFFGAEFTKVYARRHGSHRAAASPDPVAETTPGRQPGN